MKHTVLCEYWLLPQLSQLCELLPESSHSQGRPVHQQEYAGIGFATTISVSEAPGMS